MTDFTDVTLDCHGLTIAPDTEEFRIEASVTAAGELPTAGIFVYAITDRDDATTDYFVRVGNPQDLQNLTEGRDAMIAAGESEYLTSYSIFQYSDLDVAVAAKAMLKTRINELVKRWIVYQDTFTVDSGVSQAYPSSAPEVEDELKANYADARDARIVATSELADAEAALQVANADVATAQLLVTSYQSCYDFGVSFSEKFFEYVSAILNEGAAAAAIRNTLEGMLTTRGAECGSQLTYWSNQKTAAEAAVAAATTDKIEAEQTLVAAQAAEDAALAAVLAVCPDFDPASV